MHPGVSRARIVWRFNGSIEAVHHGAFYCRLVDDRLSPHLLFDRY
jgi:hypothetical protein